MDRCPICGESWGLYKEILDNGQAQIHCMKSNCQWRSQPMDRHWLKVYPTREELKRKYDS